MKLFLRFLTTAALIASASFYAAFAQATKPPAGPTTQALSVAKTPMAVKPSAGWITYDDATFTPVADSISLHLEAARKAFEAKDTEKAAAEMRTVAKELREQATRAAKADEAHAQSELKLAQDTSRRMNSVASKISAAAAGIENGKIKTMADLNQSIDKAARADMERRWLVTDVTTWYPVTAEPQRHFGSAVEAYAKQDYKAAATEIRKATGYLRLEAGRVTGDARQALDSSVVELDKLAASVEKGAVKDEKGLDKTFAKANDALALAHRAKAAEAWTRKEYHKAGYELKAAAHGLESAATWAGVEAKTSAAGAVADTKALGDKLVAGTTWTRDEVGRGFEELGRALNKLGHEIGAKQQAAPVKSGS